IPALDVLDLDREPRRAQRLSHVLDALVLARRVPDVPVAAAVRTQRRVDDEEAGVARPREAEEALLARMEDVDDAQAPIADQLADVGAEVDRDAVGEASPAAQRDPESLADRA